MKNLSEKEMLETEGGIKIALGATSLIIGIASFLAGFLDGFNNPKSCNK